jgi:hypothetical protein
MSDVVCLSVPLEDLRQLLALAVDAADEIEAELDAKYPSRESQPVQMRRYNRDMTLPNNLRSAVSQIATANPDI